MPNCAPIEPTLPAADICTHVGKMFIAHQAARNAHSKHIQAIVQRRHLDERLRAVPQEDPEYHALLDEITTKAVIAREQHRLHVGCQLLITRLRAAYPEYDGHVAAHLGELAQGD